MIDNFEKLGTRINLFIISGDFVNSHFAFKHNVSVVGFIGGFIIYR